MQLGNGRREEKTKACAATVEVERFEAERSGMLHALRIACAVIFHTNHEIAILFPGGQAYSGFGIADGVIDGVVKHPGKQIVIEETINAIGFDGVINAKALKQGNVSCHVLGEKIRYKVFINMG